MTLATKNTGEGGRFSFAWVCPVSIWDCDERVANRKTRNARLYPTVHRGAADLLRDMREFGGYDNASP